MKIGSKLRPLLLASAFLGASFSGDTTPELGLVNDSTTFPIGLEALEKRLGGVSELVGPIAVSWINCPDGGESTQSVKVSAYTSQHSYASDGRVLDTNEASFVDITQVKRYRDENGDVVAWCGRSIGDVALWAVDGPVPGAIIVIPNSRQADGDLCTLVTKGEEGTCPGQPIEYSTAPITASQ